MSLKSECEASIFSFAPLHKQLNSQILKEHQDYVGIVILLHKEQYEKHKAEGLDSFTLPADIQAHLTEIKPY